jgi:hypothetical protein
MTHVPHVAMDLGPGKGVTERESRPRGYTRACSSCRPGHTHAWRWLAPVARRPDPAARFLFPVTRRPVRVGAGALDPVAAAPGVIGAGPVPVTADPDMMRTRRMGACNSPRRRRGVRGDHYRARMGITGRVVVHAAAEGGGGHNRQKQYGDGRFHACDLSLRRQSWFSHLTDCRDPG